MSQTPSVRADLGAIAVIAMFTLIGVLVSVASLTLYVSHKGAAFGLIPMFMGAMLSVWGAVKLTRLMAARLSRGAA